MQRTADFHVRTRQGPGNPHIRPGVSFLETCTRMLVYCEHFPVTLWIWSQIFTTSRNSLCSFAGASQAALVVKNPPANAGDTETWVPCLGQEDPPDECMQPTPVFLPGESHQQWSLALQSMGSQRITEHAYVSMCMYVLEKEVATHSSILAWRIPWLEEPGRLQSMGSQDSDTTDRLRKHTYVCIKWLC